MMMTLRSGHTLFARWLLALALIAIGTHAAIPQGYMFDRDSASGTMSVVFCTGHGMETRRLDMASGAIVDHESGSGQTTEDGMCAFAAAQSVTPVLDTSPPLLPQLSVERQVTRLVKLRLAAETPPTPPARGPPHRV